MEKIFIKLRKHLWVNCKDIIEVRSNDSQQATVTYRDIDSGQEAITYTVVHIEGECAASFMAWLESVTVEVSSENISQQKSQPLTASAAGIADKILADYVFHGKADCLRQDIVQSLTAAMAASSAMSDATRK